MPSITVQSEFLDFSDRLDRSDSTAFFGISQVLANFWAGSVPSLIHHLTIRSHTPSDFAASFAVRNPMSIVLMLPFYQARKCLKRQIAAGDNRPAADRERDAEVPQSGDGPANLSVAAAKAGDGIRTRDVQLGKLDPGLELRLAPLRHLAPRRPAE